MVGVRIYLRATDMDHVMQAQVRRGTSREINLDAIGKQLELKGKCQVSALHSYTNGIIKGIYLTNLAD
jgi:hypothetical protein